MKKIFLPSSFFPLKKGFSIRNPPKSLSLPHLPSSISLDFSHKLLGEFSQFRWFRRRRMAAVGGVKEVEGSANSLEIDTLARFAVDEHNKKQNSLLQFGKVVNTKQQVVAGTVYYITLEATDGGAKKVYEAKIWSKPWLNFQELQEFKFIGDA